MKLRSLNNAGIDAFGAYISSHLEGMPLDYPHALLQDPAHSTELPVSIDVKPAGNFAQRFDAAEYLFAQLAPLRTQRYHALERERGVWAWLSLLWLPQICTTDENGRPKLGARALYIPEIHEARRYYRHLLLGPYMVYRTHSSRASIVEPVLCDPMHVSTSEHFKLAIESPQFINSRAVLGVIRHLYYDPEKRALVRGAGIKGPGGLRRLGAVLGQLEKTFDLHTIETNALLKLLPAEFDRFANRAQPLPADRTIRTQPIATSTDRFRIGDYELREPDNRQILLWAKALSIKPPELLRRLASTVLEKVQARPFESEGARQEISFEIKDGALVSLAWDFDELPLVNFQWVEGLRVEKLGFKGTPPRAPELALNLPCLSILRLHQTDLAKLDLSKVPQLTNLSCDNNNLKQLDLSDVGGLTFLSCDNNQISELDFSDVRGLVELDCSENQITMLDLSHVPALTSLNCYKNQLTELDLSDVPALTHLHCDVNQLTELDLSDVPGLTHLYCDDNQLTELDLSNVPELAVLVCWGNQLSALDLSDVAGLEHLYCHVNQLTELNLSLVPGLTNLMCSKNQLTELDLSNVPGLTELLCWGNQLSELDLSHVAELTDLDCDKNQLTELDLSSVPGLTELRCTGNQLSALDLSDVAGLKVLGCGDNQLTELDLSDVPGLTHLSCDDNELTELDLSHVAELTKLYCEQNQLTELDLSDVPGLTELLCSDNQLTELDLSNVPGLMELLFWENQL